MPATDLHHADCFSRRESLADYLARMDYVSSSALRRFLRTGKPPEQAMIPDPTPRDASLGDALHALLLEPERFAESYLPLDRETAAPSDADQTATESRIRLSADEATALKSMQRAILTHAKAPLANWLAAGEKELSIYWTDTTGGRWKGRPDCFSGEVILELKTTSDVRPARFAKARRRFGYDLQAALYLEGVARLTGSRPRFLYVTVETTRPHVVWVHELGAEELNFACVALDEARTLFNRARLCTAIVGERN
ncbi:MAG: PD-(D/E)XK nuclease-like domain-containing protein [Betaproteobacteria bacterium]